MKTTSLAQRRRAPRLASTVIPVALALAACDGASQSDNPGGDRPPPPVTTVNIEPQRVQVEGVYAGRVRGSREVEVRARVEGILEERLYVEGQVVEEGAPLFRIDSESYEIALQRAQAEREDARANLKHAETEWGRISGLHEHDAVSDSERDRALTNRDLAEAHLALAEAAVADARRNLRYTRVEAPVSGITGLESFSEGNLVDRGTLLTTVTQHDPVHVRFALPEDDAAVQRVARRAMARGESEHRYDAALQRPDGTEYAPTGEVDFTASIIDPRTGTVTARAVFSNPDHELVPGQFVRVKLLIEELDEVFVIKESAVGQGRAGPRVFTVDDDDIAHARPVKLGPVVDEGQVILEGLESGDRLVINGHVALEDGIKVARDRSAEDER